MARVTVLGIDIFRRVFPSVGGKQHGHCKISFSKGMSNPMSAEPYTQEHKEERTQAQSPDLPLKKSMYQKSEVIAGQHLLTVMKRSNQSQGSSVAQHQ